MSPGSVGLRELGFGLGQQTVTLYDSSSGINYICTEGAVEILTIGGGVVTGRIDARSDANTSVNGNFTAAYQ